MFFRNTQCLACQTPLGYDPVRRALLPLEPVAGEPGAWRAVAVGRRRPGARSYRRCRHFDGPGGCNWLVEAGDAHAGEPPLCRSCRLTRTLPDLTVPENAGYWQLISSAQRRLVSTLLGLGLPVKSRTAEDPQHGLAFDLLRAPPGGPAVVTGHADGVITLDVEEADDSIRERRRHDLHEPYRTLLGHLRHETGHYYWMRLVDGGSGSRWIEPFRAVFGDEREDYAAALQRHYQQGAPPDWAQRHVSAYASSHPWEDWAETWAHYLHLGDTLDTARSFGVDGESVELDYERFALDTLGELAEPDRGQAEAFLGLVNGWMELTGVLNELSRSMGLHDFYPFVLSRPALRKLYLVHRVIGAPVAG